MEECKGRGQVGPGVAVLDDHKGFLQLTKEALENLIRKDPITDHYEVEQTPFARGKFAAVRRARCLRSGTWYAAKVMRKRRRAQDVRHEILHEAAVLVLAKSSPRIVTLHQLYETASEVILVLELAGGGELQRVIDEEESLQEDVVRQYMRNILRGLHYLHTHNIAHLDLKPQNLLLMGKHPKSDVKLCDFGISRIILSNIEVREVLGTPDYVAPEILQYEPISLATDMWSVGVLVYVLLTGHSPFGGDTKQETFLNISQGQVDFPEDLFNNVSTQAIDFITHLLIVDPSSRMTVEDALQHQWLSGVTSPLSSPLISSSSPSCTSEKNAKRVDTPHKDVSDGKTGRSSPRINGSPNNIPLANGTESNSHTSKRLVSSSRSISPLLSSSMATTVKLARELEVHTYHGSREVDSSNKNTKTINKENNKNSLNKSSESILLGHSKDLSVGNSKPRSVPKSIVKHTREPEVSRKSVLAKEIGKENKDSPKEKLKPSPLSMRRQSTKCDPSSAEQPKFSSLQAPVSIILEKGIIC